jgi:hypothetical protein
VCNDPYLTKDFYILAPGSSVKSSTKDGGYGNMSGTSQADPAVAGSVGIIHQLWPYMKGRNIARLLFQTADKTITGYDENVHGQGLLDLDKATRPVGNLQIALDGRTGSTTVLSGSIEGINLEGGVSSVLSSVSTVDDFDRDYTVNLTTGVNSNDDWNAQPLRQVVHTSNQSWGSKLVGQAFTVDNFDITVGNNSENYSIGYNMELTESVTAKLSYAHTDYNPWVSFSGMWGETKNTHTVDASLTYKAENGMYVQGGLLNTKSTFDKGMVQDISTISAGYMVAGYEADSWKVYGGVKPHVIDGELDLKVPTSVTRDGTMKYTKVKAELQSEVTGFIGANAKFDIDEDETISFGGAVDTTGDALVNLSYSLKF